MSAAQERKKRFQRSVKRRFKEIDMELRGQHKKHLDALLGISRAEIKKLTPDTTNIDIYNKLIAVVTEATRQNVAIADLREAIENLGDIAKKIAKKVPGLMLPS